MLDLCCQGGCVSLIYCAVRMDACHWLVVSSEWIVHASHWLTVPRMDPSHWFVVLSETHARHVMDTYLTASVVLSVRMRQEGCVPLVDCVVSVDASR